MSYFTARNRRVLDSVVKGNLSKAKASRLLKISRKTIYQWLKIYSGEISRSGNKASRYDVIKIAARNPELSISKIQKELQSRNKSLSRRSIWKILRQHNINSVEKRKEYSAKFNNGTRLTPIARRDLMESVEAGRERATNICLRLGISRKTYAKWKRRYMKAKDGGTYALDALSDKHLKGSAHPRGISEDTINKILELVVHDPSLSSHRLAHLLPEVGNHGVQNVLRRMGLNLYKNRVEYAAGRREAQLPVAKPVPVLNRIRSVFESFTPSVAPAPPPTFKQLVKPFFTSFVTSGLFSLGLISWFGIILSAGSLSSSLGLIFATFALILGTFFLLYSFKYYITLAIVLSFSQQTTDDKQQTTRGNILSWLLGSFDKSGFAVSNSYGKRHS